MKRSFPHPLLLYGTPQDLKPELVYARISGYGQTGPRATQPGYASTCEAYGGLRYLNGCVVGWCACLPACTLPCKQGTCGPCKKLVVPARKM